MISKIVAHLGEKTVEYSLPIGEGSLYLNEYLGKTLSLTFEGEIICLGCKKRIKKSYQQGYCFPCTQRLAQCDLCIMKPERCHSHLGTCREPQWADTNCMIPHYVYLANTSNLKVGITRATQIPTRWIDQGAVTGLPIFLVPNRRLSGFVEVLFAKKISDKSDWRKLLLGNIETVDLVAERTRLFNEFSDEIQKLKSEWGEESITQITNSEVTYIHYPVLEYPKKIHSLSWDRLPTIEGTLLGIKGQYLIFDEGVINIRKHSGYVLKIG